MARRPHRLGVVALAGALASCGTDAPPAAAPTPTLSPLEQAQVWTETVCGALDPVIGHLAAPPAFEVKQPLATQQAYGAYLAEGLARTDAARAAIAAAGPAPVANGDQIAEQVRGNVADLRANLVEAKAEIDRTDPGDTGSLGHTLVGATGVIGALLNGAQVARTLHSDPVLGDAYDRSPTCAQLRPSTPGRTSAPTPPR
jgi:hypothetical protein